MSERGQRQNQNRPGASGEYTGRARASFEVEEFVPERRPARRGAAAPDAAQPRPGEARPSRPEGQRPRSASPRPVDSTQRSPAPQPRAAEAARRAASGPRAAEPAPRPADRQPRAASPKSRPTASATDRTATSADHPAGESPLRRPAPDSRETEYSRPRPQARPAAAPERAARANPLAALPEWARLGIVAVVLVALIGVVGTIITTSGTQQDRTVIRPLASGTDAPQPGDDAAQVVSAATADGTTGTSVPANPGAQANPTDAANPVPTDQNGAGTNAEATNAPANIPEGELRRVTIRMAGDVIIDTEMLEGSFDKNTERYDFSPYFELIGDTLSRSDYTMVNIEASLRRGKYGYSGYPQFTTPPVILQALKNKGCDMITMCNNHMLDGFCDGIVESVGYVNDARLDHIGGFVDEEDSQTPEIYTIGGIRVGFVTYTQVTNSVENHCDERYKFLVKYLKNAKFADDVAKARSAGAEVVVAVTHWGEEYKRAPESSTVSYAKQLVAAGADIIIGGHPHMVQPAEYLTATDSSGKTRTALCVYSLGNFVSQHVMKYTDSGIVFEFTIQENTDGSFSIVEPGYVPVFVWKWPLTGEDGRTRTSKDGKTIYDLRVMPIAPYMETPPQGMDADQYNRMRECWMETLEVMGNNSVLQVLSQ